MWASRVSTSHHFVDCILSVNACLNSLLPRTSQGRIQDFKIGGVGIINNKTSGGGGGGDAVHLRSIQRAGGGGCCPSAFGQFNEGGGGGGGLSRTTACGGKKVILDKRGGCNHHPTPPVSAPASYLMTKHIFRSACVDMASVYLS